MTVESASSISQLDTTLPTAADLISEGDDHLRLIKTVLKTQFPNFGTNAVTATAAQLNYTIGLSEPLVASLAAKGAIAGQTWTGTHDFSGATSVRAPTVAAGDNSTKIATTAYVASVALSTALPGQAGNAGKLITTDGTTANWSDTVSGINIVGTASRIGGSFSGGTTPSDRTMFQTVTTNTATSVGVLPNGAIVAPAAKSAEVVLYDTQGSNYGYGEFSLRQGAGGSVRIASGNSGTGNLYPLYFDVGVTTRLAIETVNGFIGVNRTNPAAALHVDSKQNGGLPSTSNATPDRAVAERVQNASAALDFGMDNAASAWVQSRSASDNAANLPLLLNPNGGQVLAGVGGFGYGPGSIGTGGTVTQATSKTTAVTLNKPTGKITMNNAALAAGAVAQFTLSNSLIGINDQLVLTLEYAGSLGDRYSCRASVNTGAASIYVTNITAGSLSEAVLINFTLIKGVTT